MNSLLPWCSLLLPLVSAIAITLFTHRSRALSSFISIAAVLGSFVCSCLIFTRQGISAREFNWIDFGGVFKVPFGFVLDNLSKTMLVLVSGVGWLIHIYSLGYMRDDEGKSRYFAALSLFMFAMLGIVLSNNFVMLFIFWELVGFTSYVLIGHWFERDAAADAAKKAFITTRIGDFGFMLGILMVWAATGSVVFAEIAPRLSTVTSHPAFLTTAALLIFCGAVGKSAQFPLHVWLPDAMEGPTPVSALIHAATMVTAGVYLVGRMHPIYDVAVYAHAAVAIVGTVTALFAATIAMVQTDIKRVLAYSTMSQIGYMFLAVGVGAYAAGFFHLLAHAFFKALLFMAAGNVIHAAHDEQDMRKFGGLWRDMRPTAITFLVGSLSLVGVIPFVGFFSKEQILGLAFSKPDDSTVQLLWLVGFVTALITGFYTGRMWWLSFWGKPSPQRPVEHPHAPALVMMVPVAILAVLATIGGFIETRALGTGPAAVSDFLASTVGPVRWEAGGAEIAVAFLTMILATA